MSVDLTRLGRQELIERIEKLEAVLDRVGRLPCLLPRRGSMTCRTAPNNPIPCVSCEARELSGSE